jgi:hypothetical protein
MFLFDSEGEGEMNSSMLVLKKKKNRELVERGEVMGL